MLIQEPFLAVFLVGDGEWAGRQQRCRLKYNNFRLKPGKKSSPSQFCRLASRIYEVPTFEPHWERVTLPTCTALCSLYTAVSREITEVLDA